MTNLLKKALQNRLKLHILGKPLKMVTHQSSLCQIEIPVPYGIHSVEQIWHSNTTETAVTEEQCPTLGANCHTGVVFGQSRLCSCSGQLSPNDRVNYQLNFLYLY